MAAILKISEDTLGEIDKELAKLELLQRRPAFQRGVKIGGNIVAQRYKELIPPPGYPGDKPGLKPLRDTVAVLVKEFANGVTVGVVGAQYPAGAHAHFAEEGFDHVITRGPNKMQVTGHVEGRHYLQIAVDGTKDQVDAAVIAGVRESVQQILSKANNTAS